MDNDPRRSDKGLSVCLRQVRTLRNTPVNQEPNLTGVPRRGRRHRLSVGTAPTI
jgi:hypothetical protein